MSEKNIEEAKEVENRLMTPEDKTYGTEKANSDTENQQKRSIFLKIRQLRASDSHVGIVQTFVSYIFGTSKSSDDE
jgi:hypothetical protein